MANRRHESKLQTNKSFSGEKSSTQPQTGARNLFLIFRKGFYGEFADTD